MLVKQITMLEHKNLIWEKLTQPTKDSQDPLWLGQVYSLNLPSDLRLSIAQRLGWMGKKGWPIIKSLINKNGVQSELILAAGLSHQSEAKKWLLSLVNSNQIYKLDILKALSCWGADLSVSFLQKILQENSQDFLLAGLELLNFKAHQLSDEILLDLTKDLLNDFREPIVLKTIRILQKRDGSLIIDQIANLALGASESTAKTALIALGCIGNIHSVEALREIERNLKAGERKEIVKKQLAMQYRKT